MKYTFQYSFEVDFHSPDLRALPEIAGSDFVYLDQLLEALSQLVSDTTWPDSYQGEFLEYVARDVYEFSHAIRTEAAKERWSVVAALMRPLQERSEYTLAAAVDSRFPKRYRKFLDSHTDKGFTDRTRNMDSEARGTIDRWAKCHGQDGLLATSKSLNQFGSLLLHHGIGLSGVSANNVGVRRGLLKMASGRVQCAMANVLLATRVMGVADTEAWRRATVIVTLP